MNQARYKGDPSQLHPGEKMMCDNAEIPAAQRLRSHSSARHGSLHNKNKIQLDDLPFRISSNSLYSEVEDKSLSEVEKRHIALVLQENNWNISKSAEDLKIDRVTLYNKIKKYGLRKPE